MFRGRYTAIVTSMRDSAVDCDGLKRLADFQVRRGTSVPVIAETTSEWLIRQSPHRLHDGRSSKKRQFDQLQVILHV